ncbi:hypothetical protein Hanom_Chr01g00043451 [Helianthus anomalus]
MKMDVHSDAADTASCGRFRHDKGSGQQQQSPQTAMRLSTASRVFLDQSMGRWNFRSYRRQRCGPHLILCTKQVGLTPQSK